MTENHSANNPSARHCPACNSIVFSRRGDKNGFEIVRCDRCKTLYTSYLPNTDSAENYDHYYHEDNLTAPEFINQRLDEIIAKFARYKHYGRLLDVGFGAGTILSAAHKAGWQAFGVEVAEPAVAQARDMGFEVFCGTLQEARYPENYFDVVTASEVLEHVPDPQAVVYEIARVVRPGGLLWLTTPHCRGLSAKILGLDWSVVSPPEHLQLLSRAGIRSILQSAGLRHVRVATEGLNPYELLKRWRAGGDPQAQPDNHEGGSERVESSYRLNQALMASPSRRLLKNALNSLLNLARLGDSLKIWAEKSNLKVGNKPI